MIALCGTYSHYCMTQALRHADATTIVPMDFLRVPLTAVAGWLVYNERIDLFTVIGAGLILVANLLNLRRATPAPKRSRGSFSMSREAAAGSIREASMRRAPPSARFHSPTRVRHPPTLRWRWLPAQGSWKYHLLLAATGIFVLGPLAGVTAAYMNFSLGFFVGGQVLAGLLGSTVTCGYGAEGKHGANYIQTAAASVASMSAHGRADPGHGLDGTAAAAGLAAGALHAVHRHVRRRRRHALHADAGRPHAADLSLRPRRRQYPARA